MTRPELLRFASWCTSRKEILAESMKRQVRPQLRDQRKSHGGDINLEAVAYGDEIELRISLSESRLAIRSPL